ncbi:MAG: urea ABC transporter permease subunit UrtB [Pedosphaera sp.]|nr:urea ABC transporter permease subunit UrtB [Pedosphaera sp.]
MPLPNRSTNYATSAAQSGHLRPATSPSSSRQGGRYTSLTQILDCPSSSATFECAVIFQAEILNRKFPLRGILATFLLLLTLLTATAATQTHRATLSEAILSDDATKQIELVNQLIEAGGDAFVVQALGAWRQGGVFLHETNETRTPFLLDAQTDGEGRAKGIRVADGAPLTDSSGKPLLFAATDLTAADTSSKLRKAIKTVLDLFAIANPDPKMRRDAVVKLGQDQNQEYLQHFEVRLKTETNVDVLKGLYEAMELTRIASDDASVRLAAIQKLSDLRSISSLNFLQELEKNARADTGKYGEETLKAAHSAVIQIQDYMKLGNLFGTAFRGLSLAAVLLVAALGLAITFGLMGVINMAHGEIIMVGAYMAYVTQNFFKSWFGASGIGFDSYFIAALVVSFFVASGVGLILERGVIRFLYKRPLESLLATWGVSLLLQQLFRHIFGAANVQVSSPSWLSGSLVVSDVLFAYNRIFVIGFAVLIVFGTYLLLTRTSLGLQIRAVMQNRAMASCVGVRTDRVNMLTFAFGSGLAGMAGACLSQIGNVGPSLGQNYIVDCFMIVVLGGVGNLVGTVSASIGVGVTDQILQPWLGAVMGKITVLAAIILFLQWRPAGLFVTRSRSLEG